MHRLCMDYVHLPTTSCRLSHSSLAQQCLEESLIRVCVSLCLSNQKPRLPAREGLAPGTIRVREPALLDAGSDSWRTTSGTRHRQQPSVVSGVVTLDIPGDRAGCPPLPVSEGSSSQDQKIPNNGVSAPRQSPREAESMDD